MRKIFLSAMFAAAGFAISANSAETPRIGVVNFATCVTESKAGKKEQENMESMRKQMSNLIEDTEKELKEIASKFEDAEDSLSPKAVEELKVKFQTLQEDLNRYQNQFYQVLNHANYQMIQRMSANIAKAAEVIADQESLDLIVNKEACFFNRNDRTKQIISQMDKNFELDVQAKKMTENSQDPAQNALDENALDQAG